jgi:hypothetical protein
MCENLIFNFIDDNSDSDSDTDNNNNNNLDISNILGLDDTINKNNICANENIIIDNMYPEILNYKINYTVKQLLQICDYYGILKNIKLMKANKDEIINNIVFFETNPDNYNMTVKRKQMWYYIEELKSDKFMKKFVCVWN